MTDLLISLDHATIRYPDGMSFTNISFEVRQGEHWAFTGANDAMKTAVLDALAGKTGIINGKIAFPFFDTWHSKTPADGLVSPQRFIHLVSFRHPFWNLSNTTDFYYQQRFNSMDAENAQTVQEYLSSIIPPVSKPAWAFEKVVTELAVHP